MPSPSSQNLRSAPQKQPMPNIAVSSPAGHGPLRGWPLTKCTDAVGIGSARPLRAVAAVGISGFFLDMNMLGLLVTGGAIINAPPVYRRPPATSHPDRTITSRPASAAARSRRREAG